ncbi:hypothetical protein TTHERM_00125130 (macronuclear) [Tetrahymena thermophila SB210]|uniref:Uncharacterized protein n=1 Tax=Tetrahymena thermophila (strain SB210) TaxID=312017 RepID=I7M1A4_TETTS|nr:hypothetical protein TTHERM_00125130 [Tetrahymena thermophila SB210]EAR95947.1 hypothetical protein TTHERM_00125130 [Tetrahymena thermophila SB210]|eukprot:XP_001016192.1 hypothetical protein TTHERM_00125130 [Tetrahymena thermophila SB210]
MTTNIKSGVTSMKSEQEDKFQTQNEQEQYTQEQKGQPQQSSKKLTNKERQNAVFSQQKQVDQHTSATKQYHQQEECIKQAYKLFEELNLERQILQEQVEIVKDEIQKENIDIFSDLREQMKRIQENLSLEVKNANEDQSKLELQIQDLRRQKQDLGNQFALVLGNFESLYDKIGYTTQDIQNVQNSLLLQDSTTLGYSNRSMI